MTSPRPLTESRWHSDTANDEVVLVDADDEPIGTLGKIEAHRRGLRHRAISVFIYNAQGRLLLQQRALGKYHSGGLWTNTCCSHPRSGEAAAQAAQRRLIEEMGICCELSLLFTTAYCERVSRELVENEFVHIFGGVFEGTPQPNPNEVSAWRWRDPAEIARHVQARPEAYTVWFRKYCQEFWQILGKQTRISSP